MMLHAILPPPPFHIVYVALYYDFLYPFYITLPFILFNSPWVSVFVIIFFWSLANRVIQILSKNHITLNKIKRSCNGICIHFNESHWYLYMYNANILYLSPRSLHACCFFHALNYPENFHIFSRGFRHDFPFRIH